MTERRHKRVMVIGGGIAGVQAALDLADMGIEVLLVEKGPSIGGRMAQLDKTFPTNDCAMCILSPKLVEAGAHPAIQLYTNSEVLELRGAAPAFRVKVLKKPRYVDLEKCTGCGACVKKCPRKIPNLFNVGLDRTKSIHIPFPQAVPLAAVIDPDACTYLTKGKCQLCVEECEAGAIDHEQKPEVLDLEVGSVIFSYGTTEFEGRRKAEYGHKCFPNVVTSMELERILSASGPTHGHILRASDGKEPKRIAWLQCVGSRDGQVGNEYCSSICCMQAAKDVMIVAEHLDEIEPTVFFMDIRAFGKGFDDFIEKTKSRYGCRFVRSRVSSVESDPKTDNVIVKYTRDGAPGAGTIAEEFDLLVLSVGLVTSDEQRRTLEELGIDMNEHGFIRTAPFRPVETMRHGVFVCGTLAGPKDIPESVMEASAAASAAAAIVAAHPAKEFKVEYPPERDVIGEPPRTGVFVCNCGINIGSVVNVASVVEYAQTLPHVAHAREFLFACSQDAQQIISDAIREKELNRIVVSACTPRTHEPLFQKTLMGSGLNPHLFEFANIREQCSWVHQKEPGEATEKAKELVKLSVAKAALLQPLTRLQLGVKKAALVIGGGLAGMTAALDLAAQGFPVHLVEKDSQLGGNFRRVHFSPDGESTAEFLASLIDAVRNSPDVTLQLETCVEQVEGYVGNFKTKLTGVEEPIEHGVVIVATGGMAAETSQYSYGKDDRILTARELEERLARNDPSLRAMASIVMIQCVGSRDEDTPYCSRICCTKAIKNAVKFREINPYASVYVLYRDIRTYGLRELLYREAREKGIVFCSYELENKPEVYLSDGTLRVTVEDRILGRKLLIMPDLLILSTGIAANPGNRALSQLLKVPIGPEGFFLEAHVKLRPVDFATDGVFVCGLAHYPKDASEAIAQARAAAGRASTVLSRDSVEAEGKVSTVRAEACAGCGTCVSVCAYKALSLDPETGRAAVTEALCKGCGACAASCRSSAIDLKGFRDEQIFAMLEALSQ